MTTFLVAAIIALALKMVLQAIDSLIPALQSHSSIVTIAAAIATAYALSYSVFDGFNVALRNQDIEIVVTGIALAGLVVVWDTVLSYLGRKETPKATESSRTTRLAA